MNWPIILLSRKRQREVYGRQASTKDKIIVVVFFTLAITGLAFVIAALGGYVVVA